MADQPPPFSEGVERAADEVVAILYTADDGPAMMAEVRAVLDALVRHARADERADVLRRVADTATYVSQEAFHHYLDAAAREAELQRECAAELRRTHRSSLEARGVVRWVAGRDEAYCVHDGETWPCMHERLAAGWSADPGQDDEEEQ